MGIASNEEISDFYSAIWHKPKYIACSQECFEQVDEYLTTPPKRILDIGCGYAYVSEQFQKKYGTELWLLEGDLNSTLDNNRMSGWDNVDNMKFYNSVTDLKKYWDSQDIKYNFVDANDIDIDSNITFDFVSSWLSCGWHYPASTYRNLIQKHTDKDSTVIFDFRTKTLSKKQHAIIETIHTLEHVGKRQRLHFNFKE